MTFASLPSSRKDGQPTRSDDARRVPSEPDVDALRIALSASALGVFELDAKAAQVRLDSPCAAMLELDTREHALDAFLARVHGDDRARLRERLSTIGANVAGDADLREEVDWALPRDGTTRRLELRGRRVLDADGFGAGLVGTIRVVTAEWRADREREQRIEELGRTVLFSEMFVGVLAHDLRNPLAGMMMSAQLAVRRCKDSAVQELLGRIVKTGERVGRMVEQLLDFTGARVGTGIPLHLGAADLMTIARDVLAELQVAHPDRRLALASSGVTTGHWDADRLAQVLSNLVCNAIQHGVPERGVDVRIDGTGADQVVVHVHNQGSIPPELVPVLFNPFRVVHHKRDGSRGLGLGLYVTRQISFAHGGNVEVASSEPEGTTFWVTLPRHAPPQTARALDVPEEMLALERLANPAPTTVTAQLFGVVSLHERLPRAYWQLFERYTALLDPLVQRRAFKETASETADYSTELRAIAERLGELNAGAREVAELHARAIRLRTRGVPIMKSQSLIAEGRLMSFELMGHLLTYYRRRAGFSGAGATTE